MTSRDKIKTLVKAGTAEKDNRALENTIADNAVLQANLDYVAMMAGIDIPSKEEDTTDD